MQTHCSMSLVQIIWLHASQASIFSFWNVLHVVIDMWYVHQKRTVWSPNVIRGNDSSGSWWRAYFDEDFSGWLLLIPRGKMKRIHIGGFLRRRMHYHDLLVSQPAKTSLNLNNCSWSKKSLLNRLIGGMQEHWYETKIHKYRCPVTK